MLSQKNVQMLEFLCERASEGWYVTIGDLAAQFHISTRMVRYNLDQIDYYLTSQGFPALVHKKGKGIQLNTAEDMIPRIRLALDRMGESYILSRQEREMYIYMQLFNADAPIRYSDLAESLTVTRKTVIDDVRHMRQSGDACVRDIVPSKRGIEYVGRETVFRSFLIDKMREIFSAREIWKISTGAVINRSISTEKQWFEICARAPADKMEEIFRALEEQEGFSVSDELFYTILFLTSLSVSRFARGRRVESVLVRDISDSMLQKLFDQISQQLGLSMPYDERCFVVSEMERIMNFSGMDRAEKMAGIITENLLMNVGIQMNSDYYLDDILRSGLRNHLLDVLRGNDRMTGIDQATMEGIATEKAELFQTVRQVLEGMEGVPDQYWDERECGLITMHFYAADERRQMMGSGQYKALVVCANGVGSARLVSAKIERYFPQVRMMDTTSIHNMKAVIQRDQPDFILTTIALDEEEIPVIRVNALLNDADVERIRSFINEHPKGAQGVVGDSVYDELRELITRTCQVYDEQELDNQMRRILKVRPRTHAELDGLVQERCILMDVDAQDWESAVSMSAHPLVEERYIEQRYVQAMIDNIREMGPYIVIAPGIAMPHSLPKDGVLKSCISFAVLKNPVSFGHEQNDPVRIVICIGTKDGQQHMQSISELIYLMSDVEVVERICAAKSTAEIMNIIRECGEPR